jgi:hypothetical protein
MLEVARLRPRAPTAAGELSVARRLQPSNPNVSACAVIYAGKRHSTYTYEACNPDAEPNGWRERHSDPYHARERHSDPYHARQRDADPYYARQHPTISLARCNSTGSREC